MHLTKFRIRNYRSIRDSGQISVSRLTAFLGRNESGKSNLLRALHSLNPSKKSEPLNRNKDFPRDLDFGECDDSTLVVNSTWELSKADKATLARIWPRGKTSTSIEISRDYGNQKTVKFFDVSPQEFNASLAEAAIQEIALVIKSLAEKFDHDALQARRARLHRTNRSLDARHSHKLKDISNHLGNLANEFEKLIEINDDHVAWAKKVEIATGVLREFLATQEQQKLPRATIVNARKLAEIADKITRDEKERASAKSWVLENVPTFIFLDEYPGINGHQDIAQYLQRMSQNESTPTDENFGKMCKIANLNPEKIHELLKESDGHETRNQMAKRASATITKQIQRLWNNRSLKVRFDMDAEHINIFISEPNSTNEVEINLNEHSRGFQWFFSFYVIFAADTDSGKAGNVILLLDEPGLYLHAKSQRDLLMHLDEDFHNQVLYTTHSPFMVPTHNSDAVRTVNFTEKDGTTISNNPAGDSRTLFPIQAALGYDMAQSLFIGPNNLVVEGITDLWALQSMSGYLSAEGRTSLRSDITITPAGGVSKMPYMINFLVSQELNVIALFDSEEHAGTTRDALVEAEMIEKRSVLFVSEVFEGTPPREADIEDLLAPEVYEKLVQESYAYELKGIELHINKKIPRIVKRFEEAFRKAGISFNKTRPMRLLRTKISDNPSEIVTEEVADRFDKLNAEINSRMQNARRNP